MMIEKVEVRDFRTIKHVSITLTRGLNVIHGDNDVGKSTLMDAIRACLTLKARGSGARYSALRPRTGGDPAVSVTFTKDSVSFGDDLASDYSVPEIASQSYFDLSGTYDFDETWQLRAGITNLLDRDPPIVGTSYGGTAENSGNTVPATYPSVGRGFYVGMNAKF